jgi:ABC-type transporter Mla subunit MlaD
VTRGWSSFKVGLFVLGAIALVLAGLIAFGLRNALRTMVTYETYVTAGVDGIGVGSPVKLKGVRVGEVSQVVFSWVEYPGGSPDAVVIRFRVTPDALPAPGSKTAPPNLRAAVTTQGLTGISMLSLDVIDRPGAEPPLAYSWTPKYPVIPSTPGQLQRLLASADRIVGQLGALDLARLQDRVERALDAAERAFAQLEQLQAGRVSGELAGAARDVRGLAGDARRTLRGMRLEEVSEETRALLASLRASSDRVHRLADRLESVDVREVNAAVASARQAAQGLEAAAQQLRRYPSGFLFGKQPPAATAVEGEP